MAKTAAEYVKELNAYQSREIPQAPTFRPWPRGPRFHVNDYGDMDIDADGDCCSGIPQDKIGPVVCWILETYPEVAKAIKTLRTDAPAQ